MKFRGELQTMAVTFAEICQGKYPWGPLGNFMNHWYEYNKDRRPDLVRDPLPESPPILEYQRWAAFCAASVEWFCTKYGESCPNWVHDTKYILPEPWVFGLPHARDHYLKNSPDCFKKRNIFADDEKHLFGNKYEMATNSKQAALLAEMRKQRT